MVALKLSVGTGELGRRMRERLRGAGSITAPRVVWQQNGQQLLIHTDTLNTRFVDGWLVANLDCETDQTKRTTLQFVYFLGRAADANGPQAATTINAPSPQSAQIAAAWGQDLQRVLWDAVLDAVEVCVHNASQQRPREQITLQGFHATSDALHVQVLAGEI